MPWRRYILLAGAVALAASLLLTLTPRAPRDTAIEQALAARDNARTPSRELDGSDPTSVEAADQAMSAMLGAILFARQTQQPVGLSQKSVIFGLLCRHNHSLQNKIVPNAKLPLR
jgi:hypothetical protein